MNPIKARVNDGLPAIGSWVRLASDVGAEMLHRVGFGHLLLDAHGGVTWENMVRVLQGVTGTRATVRVGCSDPALIIRALDLGAVGVVIPMICTAQQAEEAVAATRHPPLGNRSFGPLRNATAPEQANENVLCLPMIETAQSVENLEAIAALRGVDGLFVGPMDLPFSLGHALDFAAFHPAVLEIIDEMVCVCQDHGKPPGTISLNPDTAEDMLSRDINFLTVGSDGGYIMQGARRDLA
jgi:4-hydroxy-2-oxoheptanedioate aldolase